METGITFEQIADGVFIWIKFCLKAFVQTTKPFYVYNLFGF